MSLELEKYIDKYNNFDIKIAFEDIAKRSEIYNYKDNSHKLYIAINNKLSMNEIITELEYINTNMLPGVIGNILKAENEEKERAMQQFTYKNLKYADIETLTQRPIITLGEIKKANEMAEMIEHLLQERGIPLNYTTCKMVSLATMFYLGIMEGKRQERAKRRGINE